MALKNPPHDLAPLGNNILELEEWLNQNNQENMATLSFFELRTQLHTAQTTRYMQTLHRVLSTTIHLPYSDMDYLKTPGKVN